MVIVTLQGVFALSGIFAISVENPPTILIFRLKSVFIFKSADNLIEQFLRKTVSVLPSSSVFSSLLETIGKISVASSFALKVAINFSFLKVKLELKLLEASLFSLLK